VHNKRLLVENGYPKLFTVIKFASLSESITTTQNNNITQHEHRNHLSKEHYYFQLTTLFYIISFTMPIALEKQNVDRVKMFSSFSSRSKSSFASSTKTMRVGQEIEILRKNRRIVDRCLRRQQGSFLGKKVSLNAEGIGYFSYGKFVVLTEVASDCPDTVYVYTLVCVFQPTDNVLEVLHTAMQLNYMGLGTRGSTLGIEGNEITLCHSCPVSTLSAKSFGSILDTFLQTAVDVNQQLDAAKVFS
jgi:Tir chaperone protein (CesT) family